MPDYEAKAQSFLISSIRNYKVFLDTCSLLSKPATRFWNLLLPVLEQEKKAVIIPLRVVEEVKKFAEDPALCARKGDPDLNSRARVSLQTIISLQKSGYVEVFGEAEDNFADNVFQTVFTKFRLKYNLMLITQDRRLAEDILTIANSRSVNTSHKILVERINPHGGLSLFRLYDSTTSNGSSAHPHSPAASKKGARPEDGFAQSRTVKVCSGRLELKRPVKEGDTLQARRGKKTRKIVLQQAGASGGEGTIYATNRYGMVAKIYKPDKLDRARYEKLSLMMTRQIDCPGVCFPEALLFNADDEFVGYLMKEAKGKELQRCVFIPQLMKKYFPNWKKLDTVTLCVTILKKLNYLHQRNIILGDINPNNILVVSPEEVYFVDTDSYQVEGYPCPVGTINFTAPEIQRKEYSTFLRTLGNEHFAVATLLFMIMLPGKPPYALQGGENQIENILKGDFAYASGSRTTGKAPEGMWRFCWSHLPRYLKDDFYETFRKDGQHSTPQTRFSTADWLKKFEYYQELLKSGKLGESDAMSLEIFPTRLKKNPNASYVECRLCHQEVEEEKTEQGICLDCLKQGERYSCSRCGKELVYTNYQKYIKKAPRHKLCKACAERKDEVWKTIRCSACGKPVSITWGEKDFYDSMGFQYPTKCKACRGKKSYAPSQSHPASRPSPTARPVQTASTPPRPASRPLASAHSPSRKQAEARAAAASSGSKSGWCFLSTAACSYFGKADDCYELELLRQFRDGWLACQPGGQEQIELYYRIAPELVRKLDASVHRDALYHQIWKQYILRCVQLIEQHAYGDCRRLYEAMITDLQGVLGSGMEVKTERETENIGMAEKKTAQEGGKR